MGDDAQSSWSHALRSIFTQIKLMVVLLVVLLVFFTFWGKDHLKSRDFQKKVVESHHLLKVGTYPSFQDAMTHLSERVSGTLKTYPYSPDVTIWYGHLALFGVAFPDSKGIIRNESGNFVLYEED